MKSAPAPYLSTFTLAIPYRTFKMSRNEIEPFVVMIVGKPVKTSSVVLFQICYNYPKISQEVVVYYFNIERFKVIFSLR